LKIRHPSATNYKILITVQHEISASFFVFASHTRNHVIEPRSQRHSVFGYSRQFAFIRGFTKLFCF